MTAPLSEHTGAQLVALGTETREQLIALRQTVERIEKTLDGIGGDSAHVRGVVDKLDALVSDLAVRVKNVKLPRFLQGMIETGD